MSNTALILNENYALHILGDRFPVALANSIETWAKASTRQEIKRHIDVVRDKSYAVAYFFRFIAKMPEQIRPADVQDWHQELLDQNLAHSTIYTRLTHISSFFEWLLKTTDLKKVLKTNPIRPALPKPPKKYGSDKTKSLTDDELRDLYHHLRRISQDDKNLSAVRDYAIFRLFIETGLRREEIIGLRASDIKINSESVIFQTRLKGGDFVSRSVSDREVAYAVQRYLRLRKEIEIENGIAEMQNKPEFAFWIRFDNKSVFDEKADRKKADEEGKTYRQPGMTSHAFDKALKKYAEEAGIGKIHIHRLRHTFARIVAEETNNLYEVQDALTHADAETTRRYVRRIEHKRDKYSGAIRNRLQ